MPATQTALSRDIVSVMHDATHERQAMRVTAVPDDSREGTGDPSPAHARRRRPKKVRK
jgi:hypothetical protein